MKPIKKNIAFEFYVIFSVIFMSFFFYLYLLIPEKPEVDFILFKYKSLFYEDVQISMWIVSIKINLIWILTIWFLTNERWWRFAIIPILSYTIFQLLSAVNEDYMFFKTFSRITGIGISLIFSLFIIYIHKYLKYKPLSFSEKIEDSATEKLTQLIEFNKSSHSKLKKELESLKKIKEDIPRKNYLYKLMAIQTAIEASIKDQ